MRPRTATQPPQVIIDKAIRKGLPTDRWITYQLQYSMCGKSRCKKCYGKGKYDRKGHGPYWRAYYQDDARKMKTFYIGKEQQA